jgi:hypothetical protein
MKFALSCRPIAPKSGRTRQRVVIHTLTKLVDQVAIGGILNKPCLHRSFGQSSIRRSWASSIVRSWSSVQCCQPVPFHVVEESAIKPRARSCRDGRSGSKPKPWTARRALAFRRRNANARGVSLLKVLRMVLCLA